jgi:hypothetical protein
MGLINLPSAALSNERARPADVPGIKLKASPSPSGGGEKKTLKEKNN